ncbi:hypothetical protein [Nitratireductor rhodophyticola]|uniref:hypothetical protein n=1 Tax=Nitratireductor rhodophyticola TaxID=2854036 RepID=UPI00300BD646
MTRKKCMHSHFTVTIGMVCTGHYNAPFDLPRACVGNLFHLPAGVALAHPAQGQGLAGALVVDD